MKRFFNVFGFLLMSIRVFTQLEGNATNFSKMAEILPPPPNEASFGKYGGIDVNLSSGAVAKSINLLSFSDKGLSVPVSLSYVSNGIKVNEYASRVGLGWSFQAGGSISRVIYGLDDLVYDRVFPTVNYLPTENNDPGLTNYMIRSLENQWDTQPDMFSFNFNGFSGRFVFDSDGNIIPVPASNFKIIYNPKGAGNPSGYIWNFKIITSDGVKYYFGGTNATEQTRKEGFGSPNFTNFSLYADNVWHLNRIEHPSGYAITFSYEYFEQIYRLGISESKYHVDPLSEELFYVWGTDWNCNPVLYSFYGWVPEDNITLENSRTKGYLLKEILGSDGSKIQINYSTSGYPDKLVSSIVQYNQSNSRIKKFDFVYDLTTPTTFTNNYSWNGYIPFLSVIKEYGAVDVQNKDYTFNYYNKYELPPRLSFAQDHWGYFNAKYNMTMIPLPEVSLRGWFPDATADREPDANYSKNGLLSSIEYPTGGKDSIEYEGNNISEQKDINPYTDINQTVIGTTFNSYLSSSGVSFSIGYSHQNTVYVTCSYIGNDEYDPIHDGGKVTIVDNSNSSIVRSYLVKPNANVYTWYFQLDPGSYTLYAHSSGEDIRTDVLLKYITASSANIQDVNTTVGGLRVKRLLTFDGVSLSPILKRIYYGEINNPTKSSAKNLPKPRYFRYFEQRMGGAYITSNLCGACSLLEGVNYKYYKHHMAMYSNSINSMFIYNGGPVNYTNVTESFGGDNFENGAISHKYQIVPDLNAQLIRGDSIMGAPVTNTSFQSGRELEQVVYKKSGSSSYIPISKKEYFYTNEASRKRVDIVGWVINQKHGISCYGEDASGYINHPFPYLHESFDVQKYYVQSFWSYPNEVKETVYDQNGQPGLITISNSFYDNEQHMQLTRSETNDSKGLLMQQTINYPNDFVQAGNVYDSMVTRNMIAFPIEQIQKRNGNVMSTIKTNFDNSWYSDKHLIVPINIEAKKGNNSSESRFRYFNYDTYGNPLELSKENDGKSTFIWDYKSIYPIAEVRNATQSDIAYTSFEADGLGNWTFTGLKFTDGSAPTGKKVYQLSTGNISKTGLSSSTTYIVSYWTKNTSAFSITGTISGYPIQGRTLNGWHYFEHRITGQTQITISGTGLIDELRLYPDKALMTTMTYEPLIGATSQCDVNNKIAYYEYDELNRLILVRDLDKNILKKYCYNLNGQTENCNIHYNQVQQVTLQKQCTTNYTGSYETYTVPDGTYISTISVSDANQKAVADMNANAQSYVNAIGTCTYNPPSTFTLNYSNYSSQAQYIILTNVSTSQQYYFYKYGNTSGVLGDIPIGNYNIEIHDDYGSYYYEYEAGCFNWTSGQSGSFYNIPLSSSCNLIEIYFF